MAIDKKIGEYQITVVGKANGDIEIPANHRYVITMATYRGNLEDNGFDLYMEVCTFKDAGHLETISNKLIPGDQLHIDLGSTLPSGDIDAVAKAQLEAWMDAQGDIGSNWTEIS